MTHQARCLAECSINSKKKKEELKPYEVVPFEGKVSFPPWIKFARFTDLGLHSCCLACEHEDKCVYTRKPRE